MSTSIRCKRVNHINIVCQDFDASVARLRTLYGADFLLDLPPAEWHACLMDIGNVIFELFAPKDFLLNLRYGPHYHGLEYQADMGEVRAAVAARGMRIVRDLDVALYTHPADGFGVSFEFYSGEFHSRSWPLLGGPMKSAAYWRDEHPLGLTGLKGYTHAVSDIAAASTFLQRFLGAEPMYETTRTAVAARAVGLRVADAIVELITPVADGILQRHLHRYGDGIRSTVLGVRDIEQARRYFTERGVALAPGAAPDTFAVAAEANLGVIFEFSE